MILQIPTNTNGNPSIIETIEINNVYYKFQFDWNSRDLCWLMTIMDINQNVLIGGIKLVIDYELIGHYQVPGMFTGYLILFDTSRTHQECGYNDLGTRCLLFYVPTTSTI